MGEDKFGISNAFSVTFMKSDTKETLFTTDCIKEINISKDDYYEDTTPVIDFKWNTERELNFKIDHLNEDLVKELFTPSYKLEVDGRLESRIQARKHKSKRINKKWLKKYGYKTISKPIKIEIPKCYIKNLNDVKEKSN